VALLSPLVVLAVASPPGGNPGDRLFPAAVFVLALAAVGLGNAQSVRGRAEADAAARKAFAETLLENAARGERARIARELHDVVAHHISMIAVQAETARLTTPGLPDQGAEHLVAIGDTARAALTEMRRLLGVLREDTESEAIRRPQPGLRELIRLIDDARDAAGVSTRLIVRGQVSALDPGVELTAYRIIQESLTNARRHAPGSAVDVELSYIDEGLELRIRDNGPGAEEGYDATSAVGHGLLGMRERAAMVGGRLAAGPSAGSGFVVNVYLPASGAPAVTAVE
jgi:signal transduction histidine kinase